MNYKRTIKILIAEDDESNFSYLERVLMKEFGSECLLHARNGSEAIELYKSHDDISIILMDIKMPVLNGFEALNKLKQLNLRIPVIAVTAYAMSGDRELALDAGFTDYIAKPYEPKSMINKIYSHLNLP
jgi:CheY-like chemotaxis protein